MTRAPRSVLVAALAVWIAGCGVSSQDDVQVTPDDEVPFGLLDEAPVQPSVTALPPSGPVTDVFLVGPTQDVLVARSRQLDGDDLEDVVTRLEAGPTKDEADEGLTTALPDEPTITSVALQEGTASVDLAPGFADLDGATQRLALAQIVFTMTARPGIGRVVFTLEQRPVEVPLGDGTLTSSAVSRDGYRELAPAP